jgi:uncharacterized protein (DUF1330 family)
MKHYTVATLEVTDRRWVADYVANVTAMVERAGGRYLARTPKVETLEGERRPGIFLLIEWPSREAAMTFYDSDEYRPFRDARQTGASNELFLVAGEDVTGASR